VSNPDVTVIALYLPITLSSANGVWGSNNEDWDRFFIAYHPAFGNGTSDGVVGLGPVQQGQTISGSGATGGSPHLLAVGYSGLVSGSDNNGATDGSYVYFNCVLSRVFTDSTHPTDAQTNFSIGRDGDNSQFDGHIAEVLVYDRVLTGEEVNTVSGYLATKYSLQSACSSLIQPEADYSEFDDYVLPTEELPNTGSGTNLVGLAAVLVMIGIAIRARRSYRVLGNSDSTL
jgi:LPXTG-motif cell wall-anchored protein